MPVAIFSESYMSLFFNDNEIKQVLKGEIISIMYLKYDAVGENTDLSIEIPHTPFTTNDYDKYEMICDEKAFIPFQLNETNKLEFYNALLAYSKLSGAEYFSFNGSKKVVFILDCFTIEGKWKRKPMSDVVVNTIEKERKGYYLQKDNKFGNLGFESTLTVEGDAFILNNISIDPIFPVNSAGEYQILSFFMYSKENNGFFYYVMSAMRIKNGLLLKSGKLFPTTFSNRLRGGTVHIASLLGLDWSDKLVTWDVKKLRKGQYKNY